MTELIECEPCEGVGTLNDDRMIGPQTCPVCEGSGLTTPIRMESWVEYNLLVNADAFWDGDMLFGPGGYVGRIEADEPLITYDYSVWVCTGNITDETFVGWYTHDGGRRYLLETMEGTTRWTA